MKYGTSMWSVVTGYPKAISMVFGSDSPPTVNAADINVTSQIVYLIHANQLYIYNYVDDTTNKEHVYTFVRTLDVTENHLNNPFSAGSSSSLSHAPRNIDAMWIYTDGLGAVVKHWIYNYNTLTQKWSFVGRVQC